MEMVYLFSLKIGRLFSLSIGPVSGLCRRLVRLGCDDS